MAHDSLHAAPEHVSHRRVSSRDIARLAGVSTATVSLVVRGSPLVKASTRARVQQVIDQMGYQSHAAAAALRSAHAYTLGYLVPEMIDPVRDVFRHQILSALTTRAHQDRYYVLLDTLMQVKQHASLFNSGRIDGAIVDWMVDDETLEQLASHHVPLVLVGRAAEQGSLSWVKADEHMGTYVLTQHLLELGHRNIAVVSGGEESTNAVIRERISGYRQAMQEAGIAVPPAQILWGEWTFETGLACGHALLTREERPTAVLALSEGIAVGVMKAARQHGLAIPADLSIATVEDSPWVEYVWPELTSAHIPIYRVGECAAEILLNMLDATEAPPQQVTLPATITIRASTSVYSAT